MADSNSEVLKSFEKVSATLMEIFDVQTPPIPVETILQHPKPDMWEEVDISQLSGTFLSVRDHYSPRMSLARLLARHIVTSEWGKEQGLTNFVANDDLIRTFARAIIMPLEMVRSLSTGARNPTAMSLHFEVPEDDARARLQELADRI